ncbi:hypothetical protein ACRALDRAFT_2029578 [Sodiomyces alcalophilus JCM 7366]|uniref:uncharacterized protein n=1 Tax=Sodiomyces alcalophilus JCM 7366 TaxID=591952 RepID=UPI0039B49754
MGDAWRDFPRPRPPGFRPGFGPGREPPDRPSWEGFWEGPRSMMSRITDPPTTATTRTTQPTNTAPEPDEEEEQPDRSPEPDPEPDPEPRPQPRPEPEPEPEPEPVPEDQSNSSGGNDEEEAEEREPAELPQATTDRSPEPTRGNPDPPQGQNDELGDRPPGITAETTPTTPNSPAPAPTETPPPPVFGQATSDEPWESTGSTTTTLAAQHETSVSTAESLHPVPTAGASHAEGDGGNNSLGTGQIVGIVFGVLLAIALSLAIFFLVRRRRRKSRNHSASHTSPSTVPPKQQPQPDTEAPPLAWTHVPADNESENDSVVQIFRWPSIPSTHSGHRRASGDESVSLVSAADRPPHMAAALHQGRSHGHKKSWSRSTISTLLRPSTRGTLTRKDENGTPPTAALEAEDEKRRMSEMVRRHVMAALATNPTEKAGADNMALREDERQSPGGEKTEPVGGYLHPGQLGGRTRRSSAATLESVGSFASGGGLSQALGSFPTPPGSGSSDGSGFSTPTPVKPPSPLAPEKSITTLPAKTYKPWRPGLTGSG